MHPPHLRLRKRALVYTARFGNSRQTDGVDFIHEDDARLMVASVAEHLTDQPSTFTNVLVNNGT